MQRAHRVSVLRAGLELEDRLPGFDRRGLEPDEPCDWGMCLFPANHGVHAIDEPRQQQERTSARSACCNHTRPGQIGPASSRPVDSRPIRGTGTSAAPS